MASTTKPKTVNNPHNFVIVPSDQVQPDPSDTEITDLLRAVARHQSESVSRNSTSVSVQLPALDTKFRATAVNEDLPAPRRSFGRWLMRTAAALLLAMGIGAAAMSWQTLGLLGKKAMVKWAPQFALSTSFQWDKFGLAPKSATADEAGADVTPAQAAAPAEGTVDNAAASSVAANNAASASAGPPQSLQAMARDLASANQQIETLKATIAELKASQQQLTRDLAKVSDKAAEPVAKPKVASIPPHPAVAAAVRKPPAPAYAPSATAPPPPAYRPVYSTSQASAMPPPPGVQPYVPPSQPMQLQPQADPNFGSAPRPPMPVQ
jgi:hypothetical protein